MDGDLIPRVKGGKVIVKGDSSPGWYPPDLVLVLSGDRPCFLYDGLFCMYIFISMNLQLILSCIVILGPILPSKITKKISKIVCSL